MDNFKQNIDWKNTETKNGYNARILFSVINKELRRGKLENSLAVAKELYDSGNSFQNKLWQRLITVAAEDVGLGNVGLYLAVCQAYGKFQEDGKFHIIHHCIKQICVSPKNRYADEILNFTLLKYIPDNKDDFKNGMRKGILNDCTKEQLMESIRKRDLIAACGTFVSLCFSGYDNETQAWDTLKESIPFWKDHIEIAQQMSQKMKPGKNDRIMAGILLITAHIMCIEIKDIQPTKKTKLSLKTHSIINIPDYALDLHANTTNRKLSVADFKKFWTEGSTLSNEVDLSNNKYYSTKYKTYILENLDTFLNLYYFRKSIAFDYPL